MSIIQRLEEKREALEALEKERNKLVGKREQLMETLASMGIASYAEGREREAEMKVELAAAEERGADLLNKIDIEFAGYL